MSPKRRARRGRNTEASRAGTGPEPATGRRGPLHEGEARGGALTGETGALSQGTEGDQSGPFVPAETAEMSDPLRRGQITAAGKSASVHSSQREDGGGPPAQAGRFATERASGLTGLQGQNSAMGGSTTTEAGGAQGAGATELAQRDSTVEEDAPAS